MIFSRPPVSSVAEVLSSIHLGHPGPKQPLIFTIRTSYTKDFSMIRTKLNRFGKISWGLAALLVGLPLPFVLLAFLVGGCQWK